MSLIKRRIYFPFLWFLLVTVIVIPGARANAFNVASENPLIVTDNQGEYQLGQHLLILEDPSKNLTIEDITSGKYDERFVRNTKEVPGYGFNQSAFWLKLEILKKTSREGLWLLKYDYAPMQWIDIYVLNNADKPAHQRGGMGIPLSERPYKHYKHIFEVELKNNARTVIYMRVDSEGSKTMPLTLYRADTITQSSERETATFGIYAGILMALFFYNGFVFYSIREVSHLYYVSFLAAFLVFALSLHGVSQFILTAESPSLSLRLIPASIGASLALAVCFGRELLGTKYNLPRIDKVIGIGVILGAIISILAWIISYREIIIIGVTLSLIYAAIMLGAAIYLTKKGNQSARYYLFAWTLLLIGIILNGLRSMGAVEANLLTEYSMLWGSAAECILLSLALAARMQKMKEDNERVQAEMLVVQSQAISNKEVMLKTIREYSTRLEDEVKERTRELVDAQQKLVISEKMSALGVFTSGIAHEINNPANFVSVSMQNSTAQLQEFRSFIQDLIADDADPELHHAFEKRLSNLEKANITAAEGIRRIEKVVKQLRLAQPEGITGLQPTDIVATLDSAWQVFSPGLKMAVSLTTHLEDRPIVDCAVAEIQQVFIALLSNAAHAIEDATTEGVDAYEGKITLTSAQSNDNILITISDNGMGIPSEHIEKIFDPFFTTKVVGRGAGLGLSMARDVVKKHHGTLEVRSVIGEGTTFTLRLPLTQPG